MSKTMLSQLTEWATDKTRFQTIEDCSAFCGEYLSFIRDGIQAVIVSQNENHYHFLQYKADGNFNVSRPINSRLMLPIEAFEETRRDFVHILSHIREIRNENGLRQQINRFIYTCQQSIGATLDALPAGKGNVARKLNGDLFERYIRLILTQTGISVRDGVVSVPIRDAEEELFRMYYQHDLIIEKDAEIRAIGSVKTSSKDRLDKIFIDKFLYNRLTGASTPHFAVFLNDVQRKGREPRFGVNTTFLAGHFTGYTIKLNPLDGVYYCDLRPNMLSDSLLQKQIRSLDFLLVEDIWRFIK
ncbi:MAG: hypothetical protein IJU98_03715 [Synergistaceae bacterium]|nr:hypothetical protein [Synergistaceae bacterium]